MPTVTYPNTIADGATVSGSDIQENFDAVKSVVEALDEDNVATGALLAYSYITAHFTAVAGSIFRMKMVGSGRILECQAACEANFAGNVVFTLAGTTIATITLAANTTVYRSGALATAFVDGDILVIDASGSTADYISGLVKIVQSH